MCLVCAIQRLIVISEVTATGESYYISRHMRYKSEKAGEEGPLAKFNPVNPSREKTLLLIGSRLVMALIV